MDFESREPYSPLPGLTLFSMVDYEHDGQTIPQKNYKKKKLKEPMSLEHSVPLVVCFLEFTIDILPNRHSSAFNTLLIGCDLVVLVSLCIKRDIFFDKIEQSQQSTSRVKSDFVA